MANNKQMTIEGFQKKIKNHYIKNGEINVESRIETLTKAILQSNKEDNPFIFDMFCSIVEAKNIKLSELVDSNGKIQIRQIQQVIQIANQISIKNREASKGTIETEVAKDLEEEKNKEAIKERLAQIDYTKELKSDDLLFIGKNMGTFFDSASAEQIQKVNNQVFEGQEDIRCQLFQEMVMLCKTNATREEYLKWKSQKSPEEQKKIEKIEEAGFIKDGNIDSEFVKEVLSDSYTIEGIVKQIQEKDPDKNNKEKREKLNEDPNIKSKLKKLNDIIGFDISDNKEKYEPMLESFDNTEVQSHRAIMAELGFQMEDMLLEDIEDKDYTEYAMKSIDLQVSSIWKTTPDFYTLAHEDRGALDDTNETRADVGKNLDMENNQGDAPIQTLDQEEPSPTFEAKTGFEKLIDKMSGSKNPLAQKLAQRLIAFKNRDKARLNSADTEKTQETFTEQSNKVRFGVGDSSLMPLGAGLRNSFIRAGEGLMQLFQGKPKEPTPAKTMIPTTPKSFSEAVTVSDDVKKNTVVVGKQAGQNQNKIVEGKDKPQVSQGRVEDGDARSELE